MKDNNEDNRELLIGQACAGQIPAHEYTDDDLTENDIDSLIAEYGIQQVTKED